MRIAMIAALDREGGIGKDGKIPWRLSADLKRFKQLTMGHAVIMGRKTYDSLGRALPGRLNIVITRQRKLDAPDIWTVSSLKRALEAAEQSGAEEAFVIGGGEIYAQALPRAERMYLTHVDTRAGCDVFFPRFDPAEWVEVERSEFPADEKNQFPATFCVLERKNRSPDLAEGNFLGSVT